MHKSYDNYEYGFKAKRSNWMNLPKEEWWVERFLKDKDYINILFNDDSVGDKLSSVLSGKLLCGGKDILCPQDEKSFV